jgi:hypothetical protein
VSVCLLNRDHRAGPLFGAVRPVSRHGGPAHPAIYPVGIRAPRGSYLKPHTLSYPRRIRIVSARNTRRRVRRTSTSPRAAGPARSRLGSRRSGSRPVPRMPRPARPACRWSPPGVLQRLRVPAGPGGGRPGEIKLDRPLRRGQSAARKFPSPRRPARRAAARLDPSTWIGRCVTPYGFGKLHRSSNAKNSPRKLTPPAPPAQSQDPVRIDPVVGGSAST